MREIRREAVFDEQLYRAFGTTAEGDAALAATDWELSRHPDLSVFPMVDLTDRGPLRGIKTKPFPAVPSVVVYFTVAADDSAVNLEGLYLLQ